jgi:putative secretion ATPase (PEP-CTERM system associated)
VYENFFHLRTKPFELVPNPVFLFRSQSHRKAISYLEYGIAERNGFVLLSGEVGSGKTTLLRSLLKGLNGNYAVSKIFNTNVSSEQLISLINEDFGLDVQGKDKIKLLRELNDFLIKQYAEGKNSILIIDEAQNLTAELLEETRMLSNLETDKAKLLHIILVGQPELRKTLSRPELRQLRQRINISYHLRPLSKGETEEYIFHRLEVAGNREALRFDEGTLDVIYGFSGGIPRLINIICDFILLSAHLEETHDVSREMVQEIAADLTLENLYHQELEQEQFDVNFLGGHLKDILKRLEELEDVSRQTSEASPEGRDFVSRLAMLEEQVKTIAVDVQRELSSHLGKLEEMSPDGEDRQREQRVLLERLIDLEDWTKKIVDRSQKNFVVLRKKYNEISHEIQGIKRKNGFFGKLFNL